MSTEDIGGAEIPTLECPNCKVVIKDDDTVCPGCCARITRGKPAGTIVETTTTETTTTEEMTPHEAALDLILYTAECQATLEDKVVENKLALARLAHDCAKQLANLQHDNIVRLATIEHQHGEARISSLMWRVAFLLLSFVVGAVIVAKVL